MAVTTSAGVRRWSATGRGGETVMVWSWPPARRTWAVIRSPVRVAVTSVSSSRAMRLRSRCGVAGSFQMAGRSVTSWAIRCLRAAVSWPVCCWLALS
jgi:hypothetical protein